MEQLLFCSIVMELEKFVNVFITMVVTIVREPR